MSQEIQLSLTPSSSGHAPAAPSGHALAQGGQQPPALLAQVHQHLRGRYVYTLIMAVVFALIGGAIGAIFFRPAYQSVGIIEIQPVIQKLDGDGIIPLYQAYVATVQTNLMSERVIREAMENPAWKEHRPAKPETYLASWQKNLAVKMAPGSFDIKITYTDDAKDAKVVCPIAVSSLIHAYRDLYGDDQKKDIEKKIAMLTANSSTLQQQFERIESRITSDLRNLGDDPQFLLNEKHRVHTLIGREVRDLEDELRVEREELEKVANSAYTVEEFARVDGAMAEMYHISTTEEIQIQDFEQRLGKNHPLAIAARTNHQIRLKQMENYAHTLNSKYFIRMRPDGSGAVLVSRDLSVKENNLDRKRKEFERDQLEIEDLGARVHEVEQLRRQRLRLDEQIIRDKKKIDDLGNVRDMANNFNIVDAGGMATLSSDKRIIFGGLGFVGFGCMSVGLRLASSLMNPRLRYSDEATSKQTAGLTLLGILPDLPDRLSDPEQASIAAHCVHQIRTMLQINTGGTDDRRVFAITSAAPADGKTSLTLALGLSYAACGTRTLLIDCDLIGAGLTARLNITAHDGVLEAIAHRTLLEYVRSTDIADVSILPVGSGQHLHASTLSPAALRRLIEEAKKHFDTILIDTGPVMGSIEASLVATAADAVVLTVSRGQQRPLVERTIEHLRNIHANVAGVVFNRAQTADFDSSISGISLRSASAGTGHNAARVGPVARAVQSAFRPAGDDVN